MSTKEIITIEYGQGTKIAWQMINEEIGGSNTGHLQAKTDDPMYLFYTRLSVILIGSPKFVVTSDGVNGEGNRTIILNRKDK